MTIEALDVVFHYIQSYAATGDAHPLRGGAEPGSKYQIRGLGIVQERKSKERRICTDILGAGKNCGNLTRCLDLDLADSCISCRARRHLFTLV